MKIIYYPASPYSRKVRIMAYEVGLWDSIDFENPGHLSPTEPHSRVIEFNPLGKIPTLVLDDGQCIVDSRVICEYLDSLHENPKMFPQNEDERYHVLAWKSGIIHFQVQMSPDVTFPFLNIPTNYSRV
jgi:glutathione S-transferase